MCTKDFAGGHSAVADGMTVVWSWDGGQIDWSKVEPMILVIVGRPKDSQEFSLLHSSSAPPKVGDPEALAHSTSMEELR